MLTYNQNSQHLAQNGSQIKRKATPPLPESSYNDIASHQCLSVSSEIEVEFFFGFARRNRGKRG